MNSKLAPLAFILPLGMFLVSCGSDDEHKPSPAQPSLLPPPVLFIEATIDGQPLVFKDGVNNVNHHQLYGISVDSAIYNFNLGSFFRPATGDSVISILINKFYTEPQTPAVLKTLWQPGTYTYLTGTTPGNRNAFVGFSDENGVRWTTQVETANQPGSTFTVTSVTPYQNGDSAQVVEGTFNCRLYQLQTNNYKTVTNGTFRTIVPFKQLD